jgi:integrase
MARRPRSAKLETRTSRLKLPAQKKPYAFTTISPGIALGYRRNAGAGTWVVRVADGHGGNWTKGFAVADDHEDADGEHVLDFWQAQDKARALARGTSDSGKPGTVDEALHAYAADLRARGGQVANAERVRYHLPPALAAKTVALLTSRELQRLRDALAQKIKPASVNRLLKGLKAALSLAAKHDARITNSSAWKIGLAMLPDASRARNQIISDEQVRALVAAAHEEDTAFGLLIETGAVTGARPSQLARLEVGDLQIDRVDGPRLMMPSSRKGKGVKRIERRPVPIPASLAVRLQEAARGRDASALLLPNAKGRPWGTSHYQTPFARAVARAALDWGTTFYCLRHSCVARQILAGTPLRIIADALDTSTVMLERNYSALISHHADPVLRRGLLDTAAPAASNVVALKR